MKKHQCALYLLWLGLEMILWWLQKWFRAPIKTYDIGSLSEAKFPHRNCVYIHFAYKSCTRCMQLMYTKCIQNVSHILTNFCIHFVYKTKISLAANFFIQNVYKRLLKCGIHFVCILYTLCVYTAILIYKNITKIMYTIVYKIYTECI